MAARHAHLRRLICLIGVFATLEVPTLGQAYVPHRQEAAAAASVVPPGSFAEPAVPGAVDTRPMMMVDPDRKLQQGDQLSFSIEEDREAAVPLQVSASGDVRIEPLCSVHVAGMTVEEASRAIKKRLEADYYYKATVRLALERVNPNFSLGYVYLSGEVNRVGSVPIFADRPMMLSQAITNAGGFGQFGNWRKVKVTRKSKTGGTETFVKDLKAVIQEGHPEQDMLLQDGDQIFVQRVGFKM